MIINTIVFGPSKPFLSGLLLRNLKINGRAFREVLLGAGFGSQIMFRLGAGGSLGLLIYMFPATDTTVTILPLTTATCYSPLEVDRGYAFWVDGLVMCQARPG